MTHTLLVECASLCLWINPLLTCHFVFHWILPAVKHQEPELHWVLKPGSLGFGWVWVTVTWVQVPRRFWLALSPSHVGLSPKQGFDWVWVPVTWIQVWTWDKRFQSHPCLLPPSPKVYSLYLCLFCCLAYRVIITIFLNSMYIYSIYMH